jgi:hypothetical protein
MIRPRIELGTYAVLTRRDNQLHHPTFVCLLERANRVPWSGRYLQSHRNVQPADSLPQNMSRLTLANVSRLAVTPDGISFVSGSYDNSLKLWRFEALQQPVIQCTVCEAVSLTRKSCACVPNFGQSFSLKLIIIIIYYYYVYYRYYYYFYYWLFLILLLIIFIITIDYFYYYYWLFLLLLLIIFFVLVIIITDYFYCTCYY